jgi:Spy/CpxP family protein refolding chaperone
MTMQDVRSAIMALALLLAGATAHAQQPGLADAQGRGGPDAKKQEEVRKKVETVRMWRLTEELKLDERTSARLASFLSAMDEKRRGLMHERQETMRDLRALLKTGTPDENKLKADLDKLEKGRGSMVDLEVKETSGIRDILSIEQQARYVIFQQEFRREMRGMIAKAREDGQGMRGPGSRTGEGPGPGNGPERTPGK